MLKDTADLQRSMGRGTGLYTARFRAPIQTIVKDEDGNDKVVTVGHTRQSVDSPDLVDHKARVQAERDQAAAERERNRAAREAEQRRNQTLRRSRQLLSERSQGLRGVGSVRAAIGRYDRKFSDFDGGERVRGVLSQARDMLSSGDYRGARDLLAFHKADFDEADDSLKSQRARAAADAKAAEAASKSERKITGSPLQQAAAKRRLARLGKAFDLLDVGTKSPAQLRQAFGTYSDAAAAAKAGDFAKADEILLDSKKDFAKVLKKAKDVQEKANKTTDETSKTTKELTSRYAMVAAAGFFGRHVSAAAQGVIGDPVYGPGQAALGVGSGLSGAASRYGAGMLVKHGLGSGLGILGAGIGVVGGGVSLGIDILSALYQRGQGVQHGATARAMSMRGGLGLASMGPMGSRLVDEGFAKITYLNEMPLEKAQALYEEHGGFAASVGPRDRYRALLGVPGDKRMAYVRKNYGDGTGYDTAAAVVARALNNFVYRGEDGMIYAGSPQALSAHPHFNLGEEGEARATRQRAGFRDTERKLIAALKDNPSVGMTGEMINAALGYMNAGVLGYDMDEFIKLATMSRKTGADMKHIAAVAAGSRMGTYGGSGKTFGYGGMAGLIGASQALGLPADFLLSVNQSAVDTMAKAGVYGGGASNIYLSAAHAQRLVGGGVSGEGVSKYMTASANAKAGAMSALMSGGKDLGKVALIADAAAQGLDFFESADYVNNAPPGRELELLKSVSPDLAMFWSVGSGVSVKDSRKAINAKDGRWFEMFDLPVAALDTEMAAAGGEGYADKYAAKEAHQLGAMQRFGDALDKAAVKVTNFLESFTPGYVPKVGAK